MQVLDTALGQYGGEGTPVRRQLNSQKGISAPYHEAVKAATRAAKGKGLSDAQPESEIAAQPLQADATATTIVVSPSPTLSAGKAA